MNDYVNGTTNWEWLRLTEIEASTNIWLMASTAMIFFMQSGFALLECGSIREKNAQGILLKNIFDSCVGCLGFWLIGYGIGYGDPNHQADNGMGSGGFMGVDKGYYAGANFDHFHYNNYMKWIFQYAFAATAATIVSGALAERCQITTYVFFSFFMTSFIYSVVVYWVWGGGWLKVNGYHDYAGSSVVHLVGGTCAFWGALILGERYGKERDREIKAGRRDPNSRKSIRFDQGEIVEVFESMNRDYHEALKEYLQNQTYEFRPYNPAFMLLGTLLLWVCWLFFNAGSVPTIQEVRYNNAPKVCMVNIISPAVAGIFAVYVKPRITNEWTYVNQFDIGTFCNGIIVGLVAVTANCDNVEPWAAVPIGLIAATMYSFGVKFIHKIHVDDPVEASPLHFSGGSWGTIAVGFFDRNQGLFYAGYGGWAYLFWQVLGVIAIISWVSIIVIPFFYTLKKLNLFRIEKEIELLGTDISEMGGVPQKLYDQLRIEYATYIGDKGSKAGGADFQQNIEELADEVNKLNTGKGFSGRVSINEEEQ